MSFSEDLEKTCEYIAILTFEHAKEAFTDETIAKESSRIERCLEWYYTYTKHHNSFEGFCLKFLTDNVQKIINRTDYQGNYIDDVEEVYYVTPIGVRPKIIKSWKDSYSCVSGEMEDIVENYFISIGDTLLIDAKRIDIY